MPKLDSKTAGKVSSGAENADSGFDLLDEQIVKLRLRSVAVKVLEKSKEPMLIGCPMWVWEYEIPEGYEYASRRFWTNRILPIKGGEELKGYQHTDFMMSKFAEPFEAMGATPDTDTDELIGHLCRGFIAQREITQGPKKGEMTNSLEELLVDGEVATASSGAIVNGKAKSDDGYEAELGDGGFSDEPPF